MVDLNNYVLLYVFTLFLASLFLTFAPAPTLTQKPTCALQLWNPAANGSQQVARPPWSWPSCTSSLLSGLSTTSNPQHTSLHLPQGYSPPPPSPSPLVRNLHLPSATLELAPPPFL